MSMEGGVSEVGYRRAVERLFLRHPYSRSSVGPQLLVGELPPGWDLPLPQGTVAVGSHVRDEFGVQVALDVPGEPERAVAELERVLTAAGWRRRQRMGPPSGGFVPTMASGIRAGGMFCDDQRRRYLMVSAATGEPGLADLRLDLNSDPQSYTPCEMDERMHRAPMDVLFPPLAAPPGMRMRGGGGGAGSGSAHISTTLFGEPGVEEIERHYREQLIAAGWRLAEHAATGRWAWSSWEFTGERQEPWTGLLTVVEPPGAGDGRSVTLLSSAASFDDRAGGSHRFGRLG